MAILKRLRKLFRNNQSGATAIEYGLIAALLALGIIASMRGALNASVNMWNGLNNNVQNATAN